MPPEHEGGLHRQLWVTVVSSTEPTKSAESSLKVAMETDEHHGADVMGGWVQVPA